MLKLAVVVAVVATTGVVAFDGPAAEATDCTGIAAEVIDSSPAEIAGGRLQMLGLPAVDLPAPADVAFAPVPVDDPSWRMYWLGLTWLMPLAAEAPHQGLAVEYALAFAEQSPDTGADAPGWDEGTNLRRLQALTCLYGRTGDDQLRPILDQTIAAAEDPARYPDDPIPNNHTVMINRALLSAGELLDRDDLVAFGLDRLAEDWRRVWLPSGFDREQAASYLGTNISLWAFVADLFAEHGRPAEAHLLRDRLERARQINALLIQPGGVIAAIGDSHPRVPLPGTVDQGGPARIVDVDAGWALGRTSWDEPAISWVVRFGPARIIHGHYDAASITWSAGGERILVDPGYFTYGRNSWHAGWDHTPQAHNTAQPAAAETFSTTAASVLAAHESTIAYERFDVVTEQFATPQRRTLYVFRTAPVVVVVDRMAGEMVQTWHLDPTWTPLGNGWVSEAGSRLTMVTSGDTVERFAGVEGRGGWVYPEFGVAVPAEQVMVTGPDSVVTAWTLGDVDVAIDGATVTVDGQNLAIDLAPPGRIALLQSLFRNPSR